MSLTVLQRPNQSNAWVASGNPIIYKMQRKDYVTNSITNSAGFALVKVTGDITAFVNVGDTVYFFADNGNLSGSATVSARSFAAGETSITLSLAYVAGTTGFINLITNRPGYNVEVELYRQIDNTLIFSLLRYFPTATGLLTMDVTVLNEYVDSEPFAYLATTTNANTIPKARRHATSSLGFYIKHREVWTGSAEAQTSDSANPSWVVRGARQIGDLYGGYLKEYSEPNATPTRKFLTKFLNPVLWPGRKHTVSFIDSEVLATPRTVIKKTRYNSDNSAWGATYDLPDYTGTSIKSIHEVFEDLTSPYALIYDKENGAGTSWTNLGTATPIQVVLAAAASSKMAYFPLQLLLGKTYEVKVSATVAAGAGAETVKVRISAITLAGTVRYTVDSANLNQGTTTEVAFSAIIPATSDTYFIGIEIIHNGGANGRTVTIDYARVTIPTSYKVDYQIVTLTSSIAATETVVSETLTHFIQDVPEQPVQLFWKNSLGGDSDYVFGFSQEYSYKQDGYKRKRMILFVSGITPTDYEALDELNSQGELYQPAYNELTTAINKSHARRGAQVYIVDAAGVKTGVVVIPTEVPVRTRQIQVRKEIAIDLPERIEPR
jgi:hypothetical protein